MGSSLEEMVEDELGAKARQRVSPAQLLRIVVCLLVVLPQLTLRIEENDSH